MTTDIDNELVDQVLELIPQFGRSLVRSVHRLADVYPAAGVMAAAGESTKDNCPVERAMPFSMGHMKVLAYLHKKGPAPIGQIAEWLQVSPPTISEQIDRMVEVGLVERRTNPQDRRQVLVELTQSAEETARHFWDLQRLHVAAVLSRFSPEERPLVVRTLKAFVEVYERGPEQFLVDTENQPLES